MTKLSKIFARDFSMVFLDVGHISESSQEKPWMDGKQNPFSPHLFFQRADGTVYLWYDMRGVDWITTLLKEKARTDPAFLQRVKEEVRRGITPLYSLYESPRALSRDDLLRFISNFMEAYAWIEAMWWMCKFTDEELGTTNVLVPVREDTEALSAGSDVVIRQSLARLYPDLGILSSMIALDEFRGGDIPDRGILQERFDGFLYVNGTIYPGLSRAEAGERFGLGFVEEALPSDVTVIHGETGSPGKVEGSVCRVMGHGDFGKIQRGQILVSPMTMADFLSEMEKGAAFVTDEGGMLCHAAIVAREMKKPCVIDTKIATKVLHDGDLVEVDADKGIVRVVKRASTSARGLSESSLLRG